MSRVFNREGLSKLKPPIVLQEFVNHSGVIFKVYVVGDYVKCLKRNSLPRERRIMVMVVEGGVEAVLEAGFGRDWVCLGEKRE
ncbi:hypothetical protein RHGRI_026548 [Rhododendron griersonianum]|uniref:inositol-1,3,4-trisphosphate 5/6-kinase n=1 Tax=Rhododendron griersonianum TaxID=479676 RepID=A0AAV6IVK3_9ERIC|nr:hypothetical protein RHGRI_026548 [Rhododendron griersonianum]